MTSDLSSTAAPAAAPAPSAERPDAPGAQPAASSDVYVRPSTRRILLALLLFLLAATTFVTIDPILAWDDGHVWLGQGRFFLYFTIQSGFLATFCYAAYGIAVFRKRPVGRVVEYVRGLTVITMAVTGVVYAALLADPNQGFDWNQFWLHQFGPALFVAWWVAMPARRRLPFLAIAFWLAYAVLWLVMSYRFAAESTDHWYPYFFLDPEKAGGWGMVSVYIAAIFATFLVLGAGVVLLTRVPWARRANRLLVDDAPPSA